MRKSHGTVVAENNNVDPQRSDFFHYFVGWFAMLNMNKGRACMFAEYVRNEFSRLVLFLFKAEACAHVSSGIGRVYYM